MENEEWLAIIQGVSKRILQTNMVIQKDDIISIIII